MDITRVSEGEVTQLSSPLPVPHANVESGAVLGGRFRINRLLGRGGMGEVYLADDLRLSLPVALKLLPPNLASDRERLEAFHSEVRTARQVTHPNVTRVYDIVDADGHLFLTMEYVEGEDLAALLTRRGRLDDAGGVELLRQISAGLQAIHDAGLLHRDLKPANIMIDKSGRAHLMDFGLAAAATQGSTLGGTPGYMAPEQLLDRQSSGASDIYALGLVLFEMFTGQRALRAAKVSDLVADHASGAAAPASDSALDALEPSLAAAIRACLHRDPAIRPAMARDVAAAVRIVLHEGRSRARRIAQQIVPVAGGLLVAGSLSAMGLSMADNTVAFWLIALAGFLLIGYSLRLTLDWKVQYKGHSIHFQNHPVRGERLFIDGRQVAAGGVGLRKTLQGTIERGEGAGERITAESVADPREFRVTIFAERFR